MSSVDTPLGSSDSQCSGIALSGPRYDRVAMTLHWIMAVGMIGLWVLGTLLDEIPKGPTKMEVVLLHKSLGVSILALALIRLGWRLTHPAPALPPGMTVWEKRLAVAAHWALYGLMFILPLDGILMSQAAGRPVAVFGLVTLPVLLAKNDGLKEMLKEGHELLANGMILLVAAHMAAALMHHFARRDDVLVRMLPPCLARRLTRSATVPDTH